MSSCAYIRSCKNLLLADINHGDLDALFDEGMSEGGTDWARANNENIGLFQMKGVTSRARTRSRLVNHDCKRVTKKSDRKAVAILGKSEGLMIVLCETENSLLIDLNYGNPLDSSQVEFLKKSEHIKTFTPS